ncbi:DUF6879 family protein [Promicromonospora sp. NPDC052451]|uniref:DUF6879 family protein n=1 Tax=Promicromonospora sp. NPDC052451 TaxID=3364407 RepID=UPI0037CC6560
MSGLIPIGPQWYELFETFEHTAYRLHVRDTYNAPIERESKEQFVKTGTADLEWFQDWLASIRDATAAGRTFRRVRVVSLPLTDSARYGLWTASFNNEAGEDIRYLARDDAEGLPAFDYWMFDSRTIAKMHFNDEDELVGFELIEDPAEVVELNYQRDAAWHRSITRDAFAARHVV